MHKQIVPYCIYSNLPASVAPLDAHRTDHQEVAGSTPPGRHLATVFSGDLIMKYFLQSLSPYRRVKKGSYQFLAKECAQY